MANLEELRKEMDRVDDQFVTLFGERMQVAGKIAEYKRAKNLPVLNAQREREKLADVASKSAPELAEYTRVLYALLFELSRAYQDQLLDRHSALLDQVRAAIAETHPLFPQAPSVVCCGVEGAFAQQACEKLFRNPGMMYVQDFEHVFTAIEKGLCEYGVLPIENSTAGSVKQVYDAMIAHDFHIVRSVRLAIRHNLLALPGVKLSDIREVVSHEQALRQCDGFLQSLGVKLTVCENTAAAAELVAKSGRSDLACISSRACAELYGLACLSEDVQDNANNHTRFICITKNLEIYPGADKTTLMMVLPNRPGSLYKVLARLYALGINLIKLESRPIPTRDFEFMFYLDLDTSIYSEDFARLLAELDGMCEQFQYLGSYSEVNG